MGEFRFVRLVPLVLLVVLMPLIGCKTTVERVSKETLRAHLDDPSWIIIDTRLGADWTASAGRIPGSHREDPVEVNAWATTYPKDKTIVTYCA